MNNILQHGKPFFFLTHYVLPHVQLDALGLISWSHSSKSGSTQSGYLHSCLPSMPGILQVKSMGYCDYLGSWCSTWWTYTLVYSSYLLFIYLHININWSDNYCVEHIAHFVILQKYKFSKKAVFHNLVGADEW